VRGSSYFSSKSKAPVSSFSLTSIWRVVDPSDPSHMATLPFARITISGHETVTDALMTGEEVFSITGLADPMNAGALPTEVAVKADDIEFSARVRIDTPKEADYFRHGGILQYVLRSLRDDE